MAEGTVLKVKFETATGTVTHSFKYAKPGMTATNVKNLGSAIVANGSIYAKQPLRMSDARLVTTTESVFDLDE